MRCKFKAAVAVNKHQDHYEEFILIVEEDCSGDIYELDITDSLVQEFELHFQERHNALKCKQKLRALFPDIEFSETEEYA